MSSRDSRAISCPHVCLAAGRRLHVFGLLGVLRFRDGRQRYFTDAPRHGGSHRFGPHSGWAWSWPVNRRIIYNGASVDLNGKPWDPSRAVIKWNGEKWVGDVPDGAGDPGKGRPPFIMKPDGVASLYGPGLADGRTYSITNRWNVRWRKTCFSPQKNNRC